MSIRVLFIGDLAKTGFGSVTTDLGRALLDRGLDVRFLTQNEIGPDLPEPFRSRAVDLAFYEYQVATAGVTGVRNIIGDIIEGRPGHLLANGEPFGDWRPEVGVLLGDFAAARLLYTRFSESLAKIKCFHYVPVEGTDLPVLWRDLWAAIQPVAMSRFGQDEIEKVTGVRPPLAYHGVDRTVFRPISSTDPMLVPRDDSETELVRLTSREGCKRFFGLDPSWTVLLRTDRNMPRKRMASLMRAVRPILEERDDVRLLLHCSSYDQGGFLPDEVSKMPIAARSRVFITDRPGLPRSVLAALYNAADIYVSTSAEGFGLTIAEAVASGVPAVALDYAASPEVVGPAGIAVKPGGLYDNEYQHQWAWPDEDMFRIAVRYLVDHPAKRRALGALGPGHVAAHFDWAVAAETFHQLFLEATSTSVASSGTLGQEPSSSTASEVARELLGFSGRGPDVR